ncbi:putative cyclin-dependent kinase F-2 [Miscanthus floridulus]|uniref:putative cyclin-dependent kinase F-2 n=1 Tax=Miscanthus floridulus TaxID=154761 RepID=UPI0034581CAB
MTSVAARVAALCDVIQEHRRTGTAISGRRAAAISAMVDDVAATAAEGRPRACRRKRRMANARGYKQEGRRVGQGERGVVVRARHRATGQAVAVKSLHRRSGGSCAADVLSEACFTAAGGGHPSLVAFRTVARAPGTTDYSIVMDYVGPSLRAVMADRGGRPFPEAVARRVMRQLLAGAEAMHRHGVVHRDIKPDNILVGNSGGAVKICNYGVAKSVAEKDPPQAFAGTMAYMAPEVLVKNADHDTLSDVWSLGCVMVEILTGKPPFAVAAKDEDDEAKQLFKIFDVLGVPCKRAWQALKPQVHDDKVQVWRARQLRDRHGSSRNRLRELVSEEILSGDGFQVLKGLLTCDPEKRLTAAAALQCPWFTDNVDDAVASERTTAVTMIAAVASKPWSLATSFVRRALGLLQ